MNPGGTELRDADGKIIGYFYTPEEHKRAVLDRFWLESDSPEAEARRQKSVEEYRRGECLTTEQMWEYLRQHGVDTERR